MKTNREIFNTVARHLLAQNEKCVDATNRCLYRGGQLSCAVGCLIVGDNYCPSMEHRSVDELMAKDGWRSAMAACGLGKRNVPLLKALQAVHDNAPDPSKWRASLHKVATSHGLWTGYVRVGG